MTTTDLKGSKKSIPKPEPTNAHSPFKKQHRAASIQEKRTLIEFDLDGEAYEAIYNRAGITVGFNRKMDEADAADGTRLVQMLAELVLDWDLVADDGETPLPVSIEELERQPLEYLAALSRAIWTNYNPPPTPDADSESSF